MSCLIILFLKCTLNTSFKIVIINNGHFCCILILSMKVFLEYSRYRIDFHDYINQKFVLVSFLELYSIRYPCIDNLFTKKIGQYLPKTSQCFYWLSKFYQIVMEFLINFPALFINLIFRSYHGDPVLNPLTPWDRPPLKNIFCIYGIDMKTEVVYLL